MNVILYSDVLLGNPEILKGCVFVFGDYMERLPEETFKIWLDVRIHSLFFHFFLLNN